MLIFNRRAKKNEFARNMIILTGIIALLILFIPNRSLPDWINVKKNQLIVNSIERDGQGNINKLVETSTAQPQKTTWDLLSLLGVPLSLVFLGSWLQRQQQQRAVEEAKEEILQVYFDRLSAILVDKNLLTIAEKIYTANHLPDGNVWYSEIGLPVDVSIEESKLFDSVRNVIRARTLSILRRFEDDPERKTSVIRFLLETNIISQLKLPLSGADLSGVDMRRAKLYGADLSYADLRGANLSDSDLSQANLSGANLSQAILHRTVFSYAILLEANLRRASLQEANLSSTPDLSEADLFEGKKPDSGIPVILSGADLTKADVSGANLSGADLSGADLQSLIWNSETVWPRSFSEARNVPDKLIKGKV